MKRLFPLVSLIAILSVLACNDRPKVDKMPGSDTTIAKKENTENAAVDKQPVLSGDKHILAIATGDLNNDHLADSVVVSEDTSYDDNDSKTRCLQIFFATNSGHNLVLSSLTAINPLVISYGNDFDTLDIDGNVLIIKEELLRGHFENKFRFQNGRFELIGHSDVQSDGRGVMTETDYNLSTGKFIYKERRYDTDKVIKSVNTYVKPDSLPTLDHFEPFSVHVKTAGIDIYL